MALCIQIRCSHGAQHRRSLHRVLRLRFSSIGRCRTAPCSIIDDTRSGQYRAECINWRLPLRRFSPRLGQFVILGSIESWKFHYAFYDKTWITGENWLDRRELSDGSRIDSNLSLKFEDNVLSPAPPMVEQRVFL